MLELSAATMSTAGTLLLAVVFVEYGGVFLLGVIRGKGGFTEFQKSFFRAGHAHAGVLVLFSLVALLWADAAALEGFAGLAARSAIPLSAILMPAGFFFSAAGKGVVQPNRLVALVYLGAASLAVGVVGLGVALLRAS